MIRLKKVEWPRFFARRVGKLHTVFLNERARLHLLQQTHALKGEVSIRHQRLANVMTRKTFLLKQHDLAALAREDAGDRAAGVPAAHNNHFVVSIDSHCFFSDELRVTSKKKHRGTCHSSLVTRHLSLFLYVAH